MEEDCSAFKICWDWRKMNSRKKSFGYVT
jgi:hypothetical protein